MKMYTRGNLSEPRHPVFLRSCHCNSDIEQHDCVHWLSHTFLAAAHKRTMLLGNCRAAVWRLPAPLPCQTRTFSVAIRVCVCVHTSVHAFS